MSKKVGKELTLNKNSFSVLRKFGIEIVLVIMIIVSAIARPEFLSSENLINVIRQVSVNGCIAIGMTFIIINGCIDLSVSGMVGLAGMVITFMISKGVNPILAILVALVIALIVGTLNGLNVSTGMAPFIMTMAMDTVIRGIAYLSTNGQPVSIYKLSPGYELIGQGYIMPQLFGKMIPFPVVIFVVVAILAYVVLNHTTFGREVYAVGGNNESARLAGINITFTRIKVYCVSAVLATVSAVILTSRLASCDPTVGTGFQLDAIAATVIGGTSMNGGEGKVQKTIVGIFIIGILSNILNLSNINPYFQNIAKGIIIYAAVRGDINARRKSSH